MSIININFSANFKIYVFLVWEVSLSRTRMAKQLLPLVREADILELKLMLQLHLY